MNVLKKMNMKKTIILSTILIGISVVLFQGLIHVVTAAEFKKANIVQTNYAYDIMETPQAILNDLPENYQKANYKVEEIDSTYYLTPPSELDMTREEAAELGAQALWEVFGLHLEGQMIQVGYLPGNERLPRSSWYADVYMDGELEYYFQIDSVTGELFSIGHTRVLDQEVSLDFDLELVEHSQEYVELANELAESLDVVPSKIKSVAYSSQGSQNNDPTIHIQVTGVNGEEVIMAFSRYDQSLLSIVYSSPLKYVKEHDEKMMKQLREIGVELSIDRSEERQEGIYYFDEILEKHFGGEIELKDWEEWGRWIEELEDILERK